MPVEGDIAIETPSFHDNLDHIYCGNQNDIIIFLHQSGSIVLLTLSQTTNFRLFQTEIVCK